jgi:hypothetical protein
MADRTSAALFGKVFDYLAEEPEQNEKFAAWLWKQTGNYDFSYYQMGCDKALVKLGLAKRVEDDLFLYKEGDEWVE